MGDVHIHLKIIDCSLNLEDTKNPKGEEAQKAQQPGMFANDYAPYNYDRKSSINDGQYDPWSQTAQNQGHNTKSASATFDARINHLNTHIEGSQFLDLQYLTYEKDRQRLI